MEKLIFKEFDSNQESDKLFSETHAAHVADTETHEISWRRWITGAIVGFAVATGLVWLATKLLVIATVFIAASTGWVYLALSVWMLGLMFILYSGMETATSVAKYITSMNTTEHWSVIKANFNSLKARYLPVETATL